MPTDIISTKKSRYYAWGGMLLVVLLTSLVRIHLLDIPLERDEGEYALGGQMWLQGVLPYQSLYSHKAPGIYAAYAVIMAVFGESPAGIHTGLLLVNALSIILLFLIGDKLFGAMVGVGAGAFFALLAVGPGVLGFTANGEHFVLLPALAGIYLLLRGVEAGRPTLLGVSGLCLGLALVMRQQGAFFGALGIFYLLCRRLHDGGGGWGNLGRQCLWLLGGLILPWGVTCLIFWGAGGWEKFWFWTFTYARQYVSGVSFENGVANFLFQIKGVTGSDRLIWLAAGLGFVFIYVLQEVRGQAIFLILFTLFSFLAVCPGYYFRPHYFLLWLPAVALLAAVGCCYAGKLLARGVAGLLLPFSVFGFRFSAKNIRFLSRLLTISVAAESDHGRRNRLAWLLALLVLSCSIYAQREYLFVMGPEQISRKCYGANPFVESREIALYIKNNSRPHDRLAVLGSEPQIPFYAQRRSATGYIYMYEMMQNHPYALKMQQEMIREIEAGRPEFLVVVNVETSWLIREKSGKMLLLWMNDFISRYYRLVGLVDILWPEGTKYYWDEAAAGRQPRAGNWCLVYRRR